MAKADSFWLTLTNIVLGAVVVLCVLMVALGGLCETLSNLKKRRSYTAELNHDMHEIFPGTVPPAAALHNEGGKSTHRLLEAVCRTWRRLVHPSPRRL